MIMTLALVAVLAFVLVMMAASIIFGVRGAAHLGLARGAALAGKAEVKE